VLQIKSLVIKGIPGLTTHLPKISSSKDVALAISVEAMLRIIIKAKLK
jgi:hypothetical protein